MTKSARFVNEKMTGGKGSKFQLWFCKIYETCSSQRNSLRQEPVCEEKVTERMSVRERMESIWAPVLFTS